MKIPRALTIAGSDPSGGAGIQADLKTFSRLKVYGMAVIAALTAQNTRGVTAVMEVPADFVAQQLDAVLSDIPPGAVKTGMLLSAEVIDIVAAKSRQFNVTNLIVDPVMLATSGTPLLHADAMDALRRLLSVALMVTPNIDEARALSGHEIHNLEDMKEAASAIHRFGPKYVLVKGGHLDGEASDILFDGTEFHHFHALRIPAKDTHGTGCVLSASIAAYIAGGESVTDSVRLAKALTGYAIRNGLRLGGGNGPCDPLGIQEEWPDDNPG